MNNWITAHKSQETTAYSYTPHGCALDVSCVGSCTFARARELKQSSHLITPATSTFQPCSVYLPRQTDAAAGFSRSTNIIIESTNGHQAARKGVHYFAALGVRS